MRGKIIMLLLCFIAFLKCLGQGQKDFNQIYISAVNGNITPSLETLMKLNDDSLTNRQLKVKQAYLGRYAGYQFVIPSLTVSVEKDVEPILNSFYLYWHNSLLNNNQQASEDSLLTTSVRSYLSFLNRNEKSASLKDSVDNLFRESGYFSNSFNRTGNILDLFVWQTNIQRQYSIDILGDTVNVMVNFMSDFITKGWMEYATFGRSYPGGWATENELFAMAESYDTLSEEFNISYLSHEGQHFKDLTIYGELNQVDLEYRAKLIELILADKTYESLLEDFEMMAVDDENNAHGYANHLILKFIKERFETLSVENKIGVKNLCKILLKESDDILDEGSSILDL